MRVSCVEAYKHKAAILVLQVKTGKYTRQQAIKPSSVAPAL